MARIRTFKPEFWTDGKTGTLSDRAKLLLLGMLNHADDYGVIELNCAEWRAKVFPYDTLSIEDGVAAPLTNELLPKGIVTTFSYDDGDGAKQYVHITNFDKHQLVNRPSPPTIKGWKRGDNPETFGKRETEDCASLEAPKPHGGITEDSSNAHGVLTTGKERKGKELLKPKGSSYGSSSQQNGKGQSPEARDFLRREPDFADETAEEFTEAQPDSDSGESSASQRETGMPTIGQLAAEIANPKKSKRTRAKPQPGTKDPSVEAERRRQIEALKRGAA